VVAYRSANRPADADRVLEEAIKKNPKDVDALLQRGETLIERGKYGEAGADLNQVLKMKPQAPEVQWALARLHLAKGETSSYRQKLAETLRLNPFLGQVRLELAGSFLSENQFQAALTLLDEAPESQKGTVAYLVQRNWALWGLGYFSEVRSGIDKGLARERSEDLLLQDALWKLRAGKAMDARAALEEALKVNPSDLRALQTLKQTYDGQKDAGAALQKVQQYADRQPKSAPVQDFVGVLLMAKGDRVKARAAFEAAKAADPQYVAAEMSLVQVDILENKVDDARKRLEAITSRNNNVVARSWLGNIYEIRNDHGAAIEQYRKVVASNPNDGEASNNLAYLLTEYGNRADEALQYAQKAVELAPKEAAYCDTLGWVLYHKGLYSAAIPYLERANSARVVPVSAYHLAMAYAKAGETKRGRATLEAALKNSPNLPEAKMAQEVLGISR
jgi:tetratricopeptide (TPR) repeat protein